MNEDEGMGERDQGSVMADQPPDDRPGNRCPPPVDAAGQLVNIAGGWACETARSGRVSGAVAHVLKQGLKSDGGDAIANRSLDAGYGKSTGPPIGRHRGRSAHLMSAVMRL